MKKLSLLLFAIALLFGVKAFAQENLSVGGSLCPFMVTVPQESIPSQFPSVVSEEADWLYYGNDEYNTSVAYAPVGIPFSWAVSFPPTKLQAYDGFTLTRVAIYIKSIYNEWDLMLRVYYGNSYMPLTLMSEQLFDITSYQNYDGMIEVELEQPVEIDPNRDLWIVFSELTTGSETFSATACQVDTSEADPNARWIQIQENKWNDMASYSSYFECYQFMIWGYVTDDPLGVEIPISNRTLDVYPNPGGNTLKIRSALENARVEIYDVFGRKVHKQELARETTAINTESWTSGMYVWKVVSGVSTSSTTLIESGKWIKE